MATLSAAFRWSAAFSAVGSFAISRSPISAQQDGFGDLLSGVEMIAAGHGMKPDAGVRWNDDVLQALHGCRVVVLNGSDENADMRVGMALGNEPRSVDGDAPFVGIEFLR